MRLALMGDDLVTGPRSGSLATAGRKEKVVCLVDSPGDVGKKSGAKQKAGECGEV